MRLHPHGKTLVGPAAVLLLIVAAALVVVFFLPQNSTNSWPIRLVVGAAALVAAIVWFGVPFLRWRPTTYEMTNRRLRLREGILTRSGRDFPLNRVTHL